MRKVYQLYLKPAQGVSPADVEELLDAADDWLKYGAYSYFVVSSESVTFWKRRFEPLTMIPKKWGHMIIFEMPPRYAGFLPSNAWTWLAKAHGINRKQA